VISNHILNGLRPDGLIGIPSRGGDTHFLVHSASANLDVIRAHAVRSGSRVRATHMHDGVEIDELVAFREQDVGGEG
jgi:hypothetical protein